MDLAGLDRAIALRMVGTIHRFAATGAFAFTIMATGSKACVC